MTEFVSMLIMIGAVFATGYLAGQKVKK